MTEAAGAVPRARLATLRRPEAFAWATGIEDISPSKCERRR